MSSLVATLLARSSAMFQTRQALIVTGLQNDFISPDGKLPMSTQSGFIDRIRELVPAFREHGIIIWVWTEYRGNRTVNDPSGNGCRVIVPDHNEPTQLPLPGFDPSREEPFSHQASTARSTHPPRTPRTAGGQNSAIARARAMAAEFDSPEQDAPRAALTSQDPELFLSETATREACCKPGTWGAEPIPGIEDLIDPRDIQITKSFYSAFSQTSLLLQLRAKLVTDLYFAGCNTNLSVYATATDVARHGLEINIVQDCLGCRQMDRHDRAVKHMVDDMGAQLTTAHSVIARLNGEELPEDDSDESSNDAEEDKDEPESPPPGPVRQSHFSSFPSKRSILSESVSTTGANNRLNDSLASSKPAKSPSAGSPADAGRHLSVTSSERDKYQEAAAIRELRRQRLHNTSEDLKAAASVLPTSDRENEADGMTARQGLSGPGRSKSAARRSSSPLATPPSPRLSDALDSSHEPADSSITQNGTPAVYKKADETWPLKGTRKPVKGNKARKIALHTLGPGDDIGNGDSSIVLNLLPAASSEIIFEQLLHEVCWQRMFHATGEVPRLVCCQGDIDPTDGSMPVYRHPADYTLPLLHWSPGIELVRREAEKRVGHTLNHVLVQLYRSGLDYISEHSDKTLDIAPGSKIVNVSFGAQRTMRLRTKRTTKKEAGATVDETQADGAASHRLETSANGGASGSQRTTQRIPMPHNSMFVMGLDTNTTWLHGIMADKRMREDRVPSELAYNGMRISLTFRKINTYLSADSCLIWGQGAIAKARNTARHVINGNESESQRLLNAFGVENQSSHFDWQSTYGAGFDVLHLKSTPLDDKDDEKPMLFLCGDVHTDLAIKLYLDHLGVSYEEIVDSVGSLSAAPSTSLAGNHLTSPSVSVSPLSLNKQHHRAITLRDTDTLHTIVSGRAAILLYLDRRTNQDARTSQQHHPRQSDRLPQVAREFELLTSNLLPNLGELVNLVSPSAQSPVITKQDNVEGKSHKLDLESQKLHTAILNALGKLENYLRDSPSSGLVRSSTATDEKNAEAEAEAEGVGSCFLAGPSFGKADCAFWSLVRALRVWFAHVSSSSSSSSSSFAELFPALDRWIDRVQRLDNLNAPLPFMNQEEGGKKKAEITAVAVMRGGDKNP